MNNKSAIFEKNVKLLIKINDQRRVWLRASSLIFSCIIFLMFGWEWLSGFNFNTIWWVIISLILIISINWWYWTVRLVLDIIESQDDVMNTTIELLNDIKEIKKHIIEYNQAQSSVDKDK